MKVSPTRDGRIGTLNHKNSLPIQFTNKMGNRIIFWEEAISKGIERMDISCPKCRHINILVAGENLNCEECGSELLEFTK